MNRRTLPCLFLCALLLFAGCSPIAMPNATELLRAPALGREQGEMQKALSDYLGLEPEYKFPKEGNWRSPYITANLDGKGADECVLLYGMPAGADTDKSANVFIAVLEKRDGAWTVTDDIEGSSTEVASLEVTNLYGDDTRQLIVGFSAPSQKSLNLYQYDGGHLLTLKRMFYSRYKLADFSGTGSTELVIVSPVGQGTDTELSYFSVVDGELQESPPLKLDTNIAVIDELYPSDGADGGRLLIIDATDTNGMLVSQIAHFSDQRFYFVDETSKQASMTGRLNSLLRSRDIDGDGIVEIPLRIGKDPISTFMDDKNLEYVEWMDFTGEAPLRKQFGVLDPARGVYIRLPEAWAETARVLDGPHKGEWLMENINSHETLFTVRELAAGETPPPDALLLSRATNSFLVFDSNIKPVDRGLIKAVQMV